MNSIREFNCIPYEWLVFSLLSYTLSSDGVMFEDHESTRKGGNGDALKSFISLVICYILERANIKYS